jgi:predicted nucleic acid-binding protein
LLLYELLNIYRIKLELDDSRINKIISEIYDLIVILGINKNTFSKAFLNARKLNISFYDSIYLSLSEDLDALLITADKKLYEAAKNKNIKVIMLSDFLL